MNPALVGREERGSRMKKPLLVLALALAGMAALATGPASAAVFKWANDGDVRALDPYTFNETVQNSFLENIYERLVQHGKDLGLQPGLAVSWETTGANVWRFHLRAGVKWQDGKAVTADDVIFSLERISAKNSAKRSQVATIKRATKIDDLTIDFETDGADPILPDELTGMDIMSKAWCKEHDEVEN